MSFLAQMNWTQWFLAFLLIFVCVVLMIVILLQRGRGGGLTGAFGGAGGTAAFGAKTGDVFTWITVVVASFFVLLAVVANYAFDQSARAPVVTQAPDEIPDATDLILPTTGVTTTPTSPAGEQAPPADTGSPVGTSPGEDGSAEPPSDGPEAPGTTPG